MKNNRFLRYSLIVFLVFTALGALATTGYAKHGADVIVTLEALQPGYGAGEDVLVRVTIRNDGSQPARVLKWFTPLEGLEEPLFAIGLEGGAVEYTGPTYKRPAVKPEDYIQLKPGEQLVSLVPISDDYDFSVSGNYSLRYEVASDQLFSEKGSGFLKKADSLVSNSVDVWVEGRPSRQPAPPAIEAVTGNTSFNKCTTTQQGMLLTARSEASNYSAGALDYLNAGAQTSRYTTWFGLYDASRYSAVTANFSAISTAMDTRPVTFDCSCKKNYYAYVYSNKPYVIYLCKVFWTVAPMTGTDSKAGTLIHEMSHFTVVASTQDYVYGQSGATALAISNPQNAVKNADNHEYFAENNPFRP